MSNLSDQSKEGPKNEGVPIANPDGVEEQMADSMDDAIPTYGYTQKILVGLGGSAGSLSALQDFFRATPPDTGMAFVVILHLSPTHESAMPGILSRCTRMKVVSATDHIHIEENTVYVIPPGKHLTSHDGQLILTDLEPERGRRVAVDLFFRTLADTHGPHSVAIVLSGADGDGATGLKRIKERGGLTIAQDPTEAEVPGMPQAAIDTGMVDWILRAGEIPTCLVDFQTRERKNRLLSEDGPLPQLRVPTPEIDHEAALRDVLAFLRARTGRDFMCYKRATIVRRISRRMQVNAVDDLPGYLIFLRMHPGETGALMQDLLISVTNFFRDREAFHAVEQLMPRIFQGKGPGDTVRIWVPACATGEEAYSLAILALEQARKLEFPPAIQVFGCDLDDAAIQVARAGIYLDTIIADVTEDRLRRYFVKEHRGYHIRREVREIVLFAAHDLLQDAPFSRIDLVSCRNLLIYLNRETQERAINIFHFSLRPEALLFLGTTESVAEGSPLFTVVDKKHRIYAQRNAQRASFQVPSAPSMLIRMLEAHKADREGPVLPKRSFTQGTAPMTADTIVPTERVSLGEVHFKLLERLAPPSILVDKDFNIVHLSANAGKYLQLVGGEPTTNLLRLIHPELRGELHAALLQAVETNSMVAVQCVPVNIDDVPHGVDLRVSPAGDVAPEHLLIILEVLATTPSTELQQLRRDGPASIINRMERESDGLKKRLRDTVEQYEASCEELKASNEELQAMNEELRSASEELETSREELQSINEELSTVNQELKNNLEELSHANGDMRNLMASTAIPTLFLDRDFHIMRFTPSAVDLFRLIAGDVGRPLADINHKLIYPELRSDAERVLADLTPIEREVWDANPDARCHLARLLPYRTVDDRIGGVVLTLVDVTDLRRASKALAQELADTQHLQKVSAQMIREGEIDALYQSILNAAAAVMRSDMASLRIFDTKKRQMRLLAHQGFPVQATEFVQWMDIDVIKSGSRLAEAQRVVIADLAHTSVPIGPKVIEFFRLGGVQALQATPLVSRSGALVGMLSTYWKSTHRPAERDLRLFDVLARQAADLIERRRAEDALRESEARHACLLKLSDALRDETDPARMQFQAACVLGEHLGADRVGYAKVEEDGKSVAITSSYNRGMKDIEGSYAPDACGGELLQQFRMRDPVARDDIANDATLSEEEKKCYAAIQIGALVNVPLVKGKALLAVLFVHYREAHEWTAAELSIIRDVAERIWAAVERARAERELARSLVETEAAHRDAQAASKAKDYFLAVLSHELRTPLAPVLMALELIENSAELSAENLEVLHSIERNVEIERRLIDDLLDVTRITHGKLGIIASAGDVHDALREAALVCQSATQGKKQKIKLHLNAQHSRMQGDFVRLQQAFWNLLQNASKFSPDEGIITVESYNKADKLVIDVIDHGKGMDQETLARVFQPFEQGPRSVNCLHGGLGLGLAISRAIVEAHAGTLTGTSKGEGRGCTFTIKLPQKGK